MYKIFLKNIIETLEKRQEQGAIEESNYLSAVLKNRRLELKMTLAETTEDICSEALLSKVERNLMNPRNVRVEMLCERLNLDYFKLINLETNDRIEKLLYLYFDQKYEEILKIEDKICDGVFIAQDEIIKSYKHLINKDYKQLHYCILSLDTVKDCLSDIELFSLLLIIFEYDLNTLQYRKAMEYINMLEKYYSHNKKYELYIKEKKFILNCKMENNNVDYLFEDLRKYFHLYSITKQFGLILYYQETLDNEYAYNYLLNMGKDFIPNIYKEEYNYALILLLTKLNRHVEAMKLIIETNYNTVRFVTLYAYNLFMFSCDFETLGNEYKGYKNKLVSLIKLCNQSSGDTYHIAFLKLMQYEIEKSSLDTICNFIKNNLLKELKDFSYPIYDEYINDRYCLLLGKLSRYKDAYLFLLETKIHLKK